MTTCDVYYTSVYWSFRNSVLLTQRAWNCPTSDKSPSLRDWKSEAGLRT